ncbi:hypothetical protein GRI97_14915 [Altererythrobacter xixiisoli]|uniref:Uncharacterized protein n=1 Tax=Croceibacterium xixiisoli TaxID=1476466 RepID=A0A6I4TWP5_9SPHN|nr:hypothetical protein [Croceibacterium xixiisoli]MXP00283.1 hypothetical protein [Croceibacterium xixiisoli]
MPVLVRLCLSSVLVLIAVPLAAQESASHASPRGLMLEHRAMLRCSAAFALVAAEQQRAPGGMTAYPPLSGRGREYFVRAVAQVMDDTGLPRQEVVAELEREARDLSAAGRLEQVMPACLLALEASETGEAP